MKDGMVYEIGKDIKEILPYEKFMAEKKTGLYLWKFPDNLLFMSLKKGINKVSFVMTEKQFRKICDSIEKMDRNRVYRVIENGISKRSMPYEKFQKKIKDRSLTADVYIKRDDDSIRFMIYEKELKTFSLSLSQIEKVVKKYTEV